MRGRLPTLALRTAAVSNQPLPEVGLISDVPSAQKTISWHDTGTSLAEFENASVLSDRRAQQRRRGKWELIAKGSALTGSKRDEVCPLSNGTGHWRLLGGCSIVTGSRCVIHQLVRRD